MEKDNNNSLIIGIIGMTLKITHENKKVIYRYYPHFVYVIQRKATDHYGNQTLPPPSMGVVVPTVYARPNDFRCH